MNVVGLIGLLIVFVIVFGPQLWVKRALARHSIDRPDLQGTGGELAEHLVRLVKEDQRGHECRLQITVSMDWINICRIPAC